MLNCTVDDLLTKVPAQAYYDTLDWSAAVANGIIRKLTKTGDE